jgi:hypothetical protein
MWSHIAAAVSWERGERGGHGPPRRCAPRARRVAAGLGGRGDARPEPAGRAARRGDRHARSRRSSPAAADRARKFDANVQDRLAAVSETQAIGYQLGRGLADTYWALDISQQNGSAGWSFLLGERRCGELTRLTGRLAAYMGEYTACRKRSTAAG